VDPLFRLASDMVAVPSVNPMGRPLSGPEFLETRMTAFLENWFRERGIACIRQTVSPGRDNLLAKYESPTSRDTILFDVHQDTVPTDGMTIPPFEPVIADGRLYGRGSCDVKGSMAAMLTAFERLFRERPAGSASVLMACTVDEEFTHTGSSSLADYDHGAKLAIVAEPTRLNLVHCHKGAVRWKIKTRGVACHSSKPDQGINAIYRMADVLRHIANYAADLSKSNADPILGPPTLSVGRIEGGVSVNVVPDWCQVEVDRRLIPGEKPLAALENVRTELASRLGDPDWLEFGDPWVSMPALKSDQGSEWTEPISAAIASATGRRPELIGVPFGTDAGPLGAKGLPALVFGPGDIAQAHTKDEWIELEQLVLAAEAYYQIARTVG
jgi:acetylornithine deacetylase